jgi:hypothetical protein
LNKELAALNEWIAGTDYHWALLNERYWSKGQQAPAYEVDRINKDRAAQNLQVADYNVRYAEFEAKWARFVVKWREISARDRAAQQAAVPPSPPSPAAPEKSYCARRDPNKSPGENGLGNIILLENVNGNCS